MKNKQVIDSWNKIEPDSAADARMLGAILARNQSMNQPIKKEIFTMSKFITLNRLAPVAACLVMVIAIMAIFGNNAGWFGGNTHTVELNGGTLNFYKSGSLGTGSLDFGIEVTSRNITVEENNLLFGNLGVSSNGIFSKQDNTLLRLEGKIGNAKVILAAEGIPVTDTVIETNRNSSEVNGVQVSAGYFITKANSQGIKNIIYLASFDINGVQVYIECSGSQDMSEELKSEIATVIDTLTKNTTPDLTVITE